MHLVFLGAGRPEIVHDVEHMLAGRINGDPMRVPQTREVVDSEGVLGRGLGNERQYETARSGNHGTRQQSHFQHTSRSRIAADPAHIPS